MKSAQSKTLSLPPSRRVELKVGGYRPCLEIGAGGMATVYIAREAGHSGLERTVALKLMHEHLTRNERFKKRFLDEARVLTHIAHPYVCRVVGFGEDDGRPYMAMEYLVGEPLSRILRALKRRVIGLSTAQRARLFARVIADVAEGMHAAHEACDPQGKPLGVVHRDVSPQNLFLLYDGTVRVLDFGIARFRDRLVQTATTGHLFGKLPYMAPEQILGTTYDRRVDIWALGIVLWELVTLDRLFRRETEVRTMEAVCSDPIPKASQVVEGIPEGLDPILSRAIERNPELRYQTAGEMAQDLELWLASSGQPVTHAHLSEFLNGFFPGSQTERRRWAEESRPIPPAPALPEIDFAREVLGLVEDSEPSLSLPKRLPRNDDLVSSDYSPPSEPPTANIVTKVASPRVTAALLAQATAMPTLPARAAVVGAVAPPSEHVPSPTFEPRASNVSGTLAAAISVRATQPSIPMTRRLQRLKASGLPSTALALALFVTLHFSGALGSRTQASPTALAAASPLLNEPSAAELSQPVTPPLNPAPLVPAVPVVPAPLNSSSSATQAETKPAVKTSAERAVSAPSSSPASSTYASRPKPAPEPSTLAPSPTQPSLGTGDVLVVSAKPGLMIYQGSRYLGKTPLRVRLPAGIVQLAVQVSTEGPRSPISAKVDAGQLNIVSLK
ncbi:MAG TPA: serine/threonine-protein kinase [Polyangiaceae bacterium]|nr:serine/threonine-protein kinase [Polyangiaceae bacterium]